MTNEEAATLLEQWSDEGLSDGFKEAATLAIAALRSPAPGAEAMREAAYMVAWRAVPEFVDDGKGGTRPPTSADFSNQIAEEIRSLPLPAPEVPEDGIERDWFDSSDAVTGAGDK